jgi:hypothetical protein
VVVIQIGSDTVVFANTDGESENGADTGVVLVGKGLADISASNVLFDAVT